MNTIVRGHGGDPLPDELREYIERRMGRVDRIAPADAQAVVEIRGHASHSADEANIAQISLTLHGEVLRSVSTGATARAAFDTVLDKLERQVVRHNEKPRARDKLSAHGSAEHLYPPAARQAREAPGGRRDDREDDDGRGPRIVKVKRFDIEPMFEEDAVAGMEALGHAFFVFLNAETDRICVLYRRSDGSYGLIEPVVDRGGRRP